MPPIDSIQPPAREGIADTHPTLQRRLGLFSLTLYGLGNMLGAGIYGTIGAAAQGLGNALWMAFAASMVAAGLTGLSYACLGSRYPRAAGAAYITQRAYRAPFLTYLVGLAVLFSGLTSMATASHVFSNYFLSVLDPRISAMGSEWTTRSVALPFLLALAFVNFWGIRESAWLNALCTVIETAGLLFIIAFGLRFVGGVDYLDASSPNNPSGDLSLMLVLGGAVLTFFSFIGFEDLLNVSEEVKKPERTLPLALVGALLLATCIYMTVSVVAVSVVPSAELAASDKPALYLVVDKAAPWVKPQVFAFVAMFAVMNTALLNFIMGSRLVYGMAKQGLLPAFLGKVHPNRRTPHVAILILLAIVLVLVAVGSIASLAQATSLLLLGSFTVVNVALVILKRRPGEARGGFEVPAAIPALGAGICLAMIGNGAWKMIAGYQRAREQGQTEAIEKLLPLLIALALVGGISLLYGILRPRPAEEASLE
ncbi:MAG: amino acid permease [Candidatus Omnitrophica bacterium]|nr:putative amino acid permease YhdG [bacterium]NUN96739.1 amino acid permease [Candidatus Omnitrophota bacterium]